MFNLNISLYQQAQGIVSSYHIHSAKIPRHYMKEENILGAHNDEESVLYQKFSSCL